MHEPLNSPRSYMGLDLGGAKNLRTTLAVLQHYGKENKTFLLDIYDNIGGDENQSADEALVDIVRKYSETLERIAVTVPLELPPCIECVRKQCPMPAKCVVPEVKNMRQIIKKATKREKNDNYPKIKEFTPYTQRPVELWIRYEVLPLLNSKYRFDIDETLGGSRGPLTARMRFLKRHLSEKPLIEVLPKLTVAILASQLGVSHRYISSYRNLEIGAHARLNILETITKHFSIFVYEKDARRISQSLTAFDAFICALTGLLDHLSLCEPIPPRFPKKSGWVYYPKIGTLYK